jgi:hypothetical protein
MHPSKKASASVPAPHLLDLAARLAGGALRLVRAAAAGVVNVWYQALLARALARRGHGPAPRRPGRRVPGHLGVLPA